MSSTQPASTTELKEYCLRKLGKPVIDINLADEQMNDMIDESIQMFQEYHFDGTEVHYYSEQVAASTLTFAGASTGTFTAEETITGGTSNATAIIHEVTSSSVLKLKNIKMETDLGLQILLVQHLLQEKQLQVQVLVQLVCHMEHRQLLFRLEMQI